MLQPISQETQHGLAIIRRASYTKAFASFIDKLIDSGIEDKGVELRLPELPSPRFPALRLMKAGDTRPHPLLSAMSIVELQDEVKRRVTSLSNPSTASFGGARLQIIREAEDAYFILKPLGKHSSVSRFDNERKRIRSAIGEICAGYRLHEPEYGKEYPVDLTVAYGSTSLGDNILFEARDTIQGILRGANVPITFLPAENPETDFQFLEEASAA